VQESEKQKGIFYVVAKVVFLISISLSLFQLFAVWGAITPIVLRSIHLSAILSLAFFLYPLGKKTAEKIFSFSLLVDILLAAAAIFVCFYVVLNLNEIYARQGDWITMDVVVGVVGILLVLEACRRLIGWFMAIICAGFLAYAMAGPWMPYLIAHKGYSIERIATTLFLTTEGIFGVPIGVAATFVFVFVLFGAFLEVSGAGNFYINLAYALTGRFAGGPAKTSVVASGFMGSVSGSAVANVVGTGSFTIPMMKKVGYKPQVAGAIEAAASTGGQLMPPIMGAGAFLMAEFTETSYLTIIKIAIVPAVLYYMTVLLFVHFEAKKTGIKGQPADQLPRLFTVLKEGLHFIIPVAALVTALLNNVSPMMAGFVAVVSVWAASFLRKKSRMGLKQTIRALERGARNAVMVSVACAAAGIIVGVVTLTGQGLNFSSLVLQMASNNVLLAILLIGLASLVLGMGLPVTASYIVMSTLAGPALLEMGVPLLVAHMIVFWYSQAANVTPPVCLASFAGAGVACSPPMRTAFISCKLAVGLYIIPIVMAYRPILGNGPWPQVVQAMVACALGLLAAAVALDRYFFARLTGWQAALSAIAALCLFWPGMTISGQIIPAYITDIIGFLLLTGLIIMQKVSKSP
jgi:TRAP transporter 4TM/12TM fusion protein